MKKFVLFFIALLFASTTLGAIYKYKDENGKWVFSDQKPQNESSVENIEIKQEKKPRNTPIVFTRRTENNFKIIAFNPYFAPIQVRIKFSANDEIITKIADANARTTIYEESGSSPKYKYRWTLGSPEAKTQQYAYAIPVDSPLQHKITQSFRGKFSHFQEPSIYAVDIGMQVGTYLSAARGGTVIWVKDDYHMGGSKEYFLDKANYIKILHEDGTYAVYAHILQGTALVKPGDIVQTGDRIARSGSSGYSTGPHLHFVIRRNAGQRTLSVPFVFANNQGKSFTPRRGMMVSRSSTR